MTRAAQCHCGDLRLMCDGEPAKISMCHCIACQRRSGSAFSVAVFYPRAAVHIQTPGTGRFERDSQSGYPVTFHFCRRCGANVFWEPSRMPGLIGVALGAFADTSIPAPSQSVSTSDMVPWLTLPDGIERFDGFPPRRART